MNTWNDDYKVPAKNICVKLELKYISTKRNEIGSSYLPFTVRPNNRPLLEWYRSVRKTSGASHPDGRYVSLVVVLLTRGLLLLLLLLPVLLLLVLLLLLLLLLLRRLLLLILMRE